MTLIRTLLIIGIVYYALRFLTRLFAPILMKRMVNRMQQQAQQQYNHQQKYTNTTREGETVIDKKPNATKKSNDSVGEYIDFEEID